MMTYAERISNRLATLRSDNSARQACADIAAEADAEIERLRVALAKLLACHTESAGWTVEMLSNRAEFDAMLNRSQERVESAVGAARAALKETP